MQAIQMAIARHRGQRRRGDLPDAGLAELRRRRRRSPARGRSPCRSTFPTMAGPATSARIEAAVTPRTKTIFVNSPSNPTGWTADVDTLRAILDLARRKGLWIIADEIYALFHFGGKRARLLPRHHGGGRPHPVRQHLLQELGDDRLADRLAQGASLAGQDFREPRPVFDLGRRPVHAARRRRGARRGRRVSGAAGRAGSDGARHWSAASLAKPAACASAYRRARSTCSSRSTD